MLHLLLTSKLVVLCVALVMMSLFLALFVMPQMARYECERSFDATYNYATGDCEIRRPVRRAKVIV